MTEVYKLYRKPQAEVLAREILSGEVVVAPDGTRHFVDVGDFAVQVQGGELGYRRVTFLNNYQEVAQEAPEAPAPDAPPPPEPAPAPAPSEPVDSGASSP